MALTYIVARSRTNPATYRIGFPVDVDGAKDVRAWQSYQPSVAPVGDKLVAGLLGHAMPFLRPGQECVFEVSYALVGVRGEP